MFNLEDEDMLRSDRHWREGIFELIELLCAIVDYCLFDEDIQIWLFNRGLEWAGNPEEPNEHFMVTPYYSLYLRGPQDMFRTAKSMSSNKDRLATFLHYRDVLLTGVQTLFNESPSILYVLCMHAQFRIEEAAEQRGEDWKNPVTKTEPYNLMVPAGLAKKRLMFIHKPLDKTEDEWMQIYKRHL